MSNMYGAAAWPSPRVVVRRGDSSSQDAHPPGGNGVVIIAIFVVPGQAVGVALARGEHDARPCGDILAELAAATHVHFKNDHAKEITVLAGLTLTRQWGYLRIERVVLIAVLRGNNVEVIASVSPAARATVGLHLNGDSTGTVWLGFVVRVIVVDAHLSWRDGGGVQVPSQSWRWRFLHGRRAAVIGHFGGDGEQRPSEEVFWLDRRRGKGRNRLGGRFDSS